MDRVDLAAWLKDDTEPIPEIWNTREFYQTALAMGLTNKEVIIYTLALVEAAEDISSRTSIPYSTVVTSILEAGNGIIKWNYGLKTETRITRILWLWRIRVWIWRGRQIKHWWGKATRDRLQIGSFFSLKRR